MNYFADRQPQLYGMAVTSLGVLVFVPDALLLRLIGDDMLTVAVWRGLLAGSMLLFWNYLVLDHRIISLKTTFAGLGILVAILEGTSQVLFCASIGHTSVSNTLFIFATSPLIASLLSWLFLREAVAIQTFLAILLCFIGVLVIVSGSLGEATLIGDGLAFLNACSVAGFYVVLRKLGPQNMLPAIAVGCIFGSIAAIPFANFTYYNSTQISFLIINGAIILPLAIGLLSLGPRYLSAPEVSMFTILEVVLAPLLVWIVLDENPGQRSLLGGIIIIFAIFGHAFWRMRKSKAEVNSNL